MTHSRTFGKGISASIFERLTKNAKDNILEIPKESASRFLAKEGLDECDTCIRLNLIIDDKKSSIEEKNAARVGLEKHNGDSRIMRVAMQTAIK